MMKVGRLAGELELAESWLKECSYRGVKKQSLAPNACVNSKCTCSDLGLALLLQVISAEQGCFHQLWEAKPEAGLGLGLSQKAPECGSVNKHSHHKPICTAAMQYRHPSQAGVKPKAYK